MKKKTFILTLFTLVALVTACSNTDSSNMNNPTANNQTTQNNNDSSTNNENKEATDATTGPSWVTDDKSLETAINESWIVIVTKDLKTDKELVFKGGFENNNNEGSRLLTLYNQDENGVKSASYTLTAPKATFQQDGSKIKGGTFKGDVYVECNNFELVDATIDGNVYFKTQEAKDTFKMDDTSKVTGKMEVQQ
ncbi:MAG: lipofamily protein [Turicibacter sp.]|nr:lipofamily protein [Turicibacter sp.]